MAVYRCVDTSMRVGMQYEWIGVQVACKPVGRVMGIMYMSILDHSVDLVFARARARACVCVCACASVYWVDRHMNVTSLLSDDPRLIIIFAFLSNTSLAFWWQWRGY